MAEVWLTRTPTGIAFLNDESKDWFMSKPVGKEILAKVSVPRNGKFHRKAMSLLGFAYDSLKDELPKVIHKGIEVEVSFDSFRRDMVIWSGHGKTTVRVNGNILVEAQSLEYGKCGQELIERIYSDLLDLISRQFSRLAATPEELDRLTEKWMEYN